jgi:tetratricopeptide (TPR) repeat protein
MRNLVPACIAWAILTGATESWGATVQHPNTRGEEKPSRSAPRFDVDVAIPSEKPERFVPAKSLTEEEQKRLEAKKLGVVGYLQLKRRQLDAAFESFQKTVENDPKSISALQQLAVLCFQLGRGKEGLHYCQRALELAPDNLELLLLYGQENEQIGQHEQAIQAYERAARQPELRRADPQRLLELDHRLAGLYERKKDARNAARVLADLTQVLDRLQDYRLDPVVQRQLSRPELRIAYTERLARALATDNRAAEAIRLLKQLQGNVPAAHRARVARSLAEVCFESGDYPEALRELERCIALQSQDERVLVLYEQILHQLGRQNELLVKLTDALGKDANNPVLRLFYVRKLIERKDFATAEAQLEHLGNRAEAIPLFVRLFREQKQPGKLLESLTRGLGNAEAQELLSKQIGEIAKDPELVKSLADEARKTRAQSKQAHPGVSYLVAYLALKAKQADLAREFLDFCSIDRPGVSLSDLEWRLASLYWESQRYDDVISLCLKVTKRQPPSIDFLRYYALALEMQNRTDEALKITQQMLERASEPRDQIEAHLATAQVYQHAKQYDKAETVCKRVIDEFGDMQARYLLSHVYTLKGEPAKAEEQLLKLVEADPQQISARLRAAANNDLGYLWADDGRNLERAEKMIRAALELHAQTYEAMELPRDNAAYLDSLGWVLFKMGKYPAALAELKKAVAAEDGDDPVVWDHLGDVYRQLGNAAEARKAWEKSLQLFDAKKDAYPDQEKKRESVRAKLKLFQADRDRSASSGASVK